MASMWDLPNDERKRFQEILDTVKARKNYVSQFDVNELLTLYKKYGHDVLLFAITKCMANDWLKTERWSALADLVAEFGIEKVAWAVKRMNGRENHSIDTVEGLLRGTIKPYRDAKGQMEDRAPKPLSDTARQRLIYPTKEGVHLQQTATKWLHDNQKSLTYWQDFFDPAGTDPLFGWPLYQLKSEYR